MHGSQVVDIQDKYLFSLSQLKEVFGPARETIKNRLYQAGIKPAGMKNSHPVYHIRDAARAILEAEYSPGSFEGVEDPDKLQPKERLEWFRSENERTKLEREQGALVLLAEHERVVSDILKLLMQEVEPLSDKLERQGLIPIDALEQVDATIDSLRERLAQKLEKYELR